MKLIKSLLAAACVLAAGSAGAVNPVPGTVQTEPLLLKNEIGRASCRERVFRAV